MKKLVRNILIAIAGLLVLLLVAVQLVLSPRTLSRIVNRAVPEYLDEGRVDFSDIRASVLRSFPHLNLRIQDFSLTYPHSRYEAWYPEADGRRFSLNRAGWQREASEEPVDTLASFRELELSLNYMALIRGRYHIRKAELAHPRIFAHYYDSTAANWDILPLGGEKDTTKESKPLPPIELHRVALTGRPFIVFTNPVDTLYGLFTMKELTLDGDLNTVSIGKARTGLAVDSLWVSGRLPADTVAFGLSRLEAGIRDRHIDLDARARAFLATNSFGRLRLPIALSLKAFMPEREDDALALDVEALKLDVASLVLEASGQLVKRGGLIDMDIDASIPKCPLGDIIRNYEENFPVLKKVKTNAVVDLDATVEGTYGEGRMPCINARLQIPESSLSYENLVKGGRISLDAAVVTDASMKADASVRRLLFDFAGAHVDASAKAMDALGEDPMLELSAAVRASVDSLTRIFTAERGILGSGSLEAKLKGSALKSQLDMVHIGQADIKGNITARGLQIDDSKDSIRAYVGTLDADLATRENSLDKNLRKGARVLAAKVGIDSLDLTYKEDIFVRGKTLDLKLQNSADILKGGKELTPLMGILSVERLFLRDDEGMAVGLRRNKERFRIEPAVKSRPTPRLSLSSESGGIRVRMGTDAYMLRDVAFDVSASRHQPKARNNARRKQLLDSLQRVYPGVPRDSLFRRARLDRRRIEEQDDFASKDISLSLSKSLRQYVKDWDLEGNIGIPKGRIVMAAFPLKTGISEVKGSFNNNELNLSNITLTAGESDISARAHLTGLRRALIGRGKSKLKLDAAVTSNYLDANELMRGYAYYSTYKAPDELEEASDEELEASAAEAELPADSTISKLIVLPSNLDVNFTLEANGIKYDSLQVSWAAADIAMRERTLQITNALAASNMGDIYFEGFYSTKSKDQLKAGFDLNLVDITAEKVITLMPAIDTIMPLLTSFAGNLDCELAATSDIDTCMNLILPSVDGIIKISGKDLTLKESKQFTKIARLLMFKDKKKAVIDNMSVTGLVRRNVLEVFPFVLDVDRYLLAASGTQYLDQRFSYHISVIRSPLLIKFGINAWGNDFDHIRYGLGWARYKNANVPVYTKQLDNAQFSLVASIHNIFELGVEKAMAENNSMNYLPTVPHSEPGGTSVQPEPDVEDGAVSASLDGLGSFIEEVSASVTSRREALKQEIMDLEEKAAK